MPRKLIIDADPGIGDAVAIALAICDPDIEVVALTATAGHVPGEMAARNLQTIISLLDPPLWPRFGTSDGAATAVPRDRLNPQPALMHGETGLGECNMPVSELHQRHDSAKLMAELVRTDPGQITLLSLGPLTNIQLAIDHHPEFLQQLQGYVCLGGSVAAGGDVTAAAEFNIYSNPEAAAAVFAQQMSTLLVPLDVGHRLMLSFDQYQRWDLGAESNLGRLLDQTLPFALRASRQHLGLEGVRLPEVIALALITEPKLFERETMAVEVETSGQITRGATVVDRRDVHRWESNVEVATNVDVQGVIDYMTRVIRAAA